MPARNPRSASKARTGTRKGTTSSRGRSSRSRKSSQSTLTQLRIPANIQRELFAVILILLGLLTLVFSVSDDKGGIGEAWSRTAQEAFGRGSVIVPLLLAILGLLIIWQERTQDDRLSGANIMGIIFTLASLLMLLEYPIIDKDHTFLYAEGGGKAGYMMLGVLRSAIGRPAALLVALTLGLVGLMLTFNLTLRELMAGFNHHSRTIVSRLIGAPLPPREDEEEAPAPPPTSRRGKPLPQVEAMDMAALEDLVLTPIAERPAHARLFERPGQPQRQPEPAANGRSNGKARGKQESAQPEAVEQLLGMPATEPPQPAKATPTQRNGRPQPQQNELPLPEAEESDDGLSSSGPHRAWPLPSYEMLDSYTEGEISDEEKREKARVIEETLASFKVEARVVEVNTGPAVTQFALQPAFGVKVSKITTLSNDLALALAASSIRIEAPVPGRSVVGIEIPNSAISTVSMREVMESEEFEVSKAKLKLPLGKDVSGTVVVSDMTKMPHLLVAGATGSGKSICVNSILASLLLRHTPDELKFIMVDPKMVELIVYNNIPHLLTPVITELERVVSALKWAVREMERRYKIFAQKGFRNLESYNKAARKRADLEPMPFIIVIIDELADLMMLAPDEVETLICRLAQMARATGIHLILATQRPSVDVVTGLIKANFPSRIAFAVTSQIDSRVILDTPGAEQLLGRGDALFLGSDASKPIRVQGTFVADGEVERIVNFWRAQKPPEQAEDGATKAPGSATTGGATAGGPASPDGDPVDSAATTMGDTFLTTEEQDELLPQAIQLVKQHQRASASLLQRRLRIGYTKAAQLIDLLEQQGVVGPPEAGRSREVLHTEE